jgi:hypothetical protein
MAHFHDEVEEHDEVDEAKDGCGGVVWQPYVLRKPHTSNKMLHELFIYQIAVCRVLGFIHLQHSGLLRSPFGYQKFCASRAICLRLRQNSRLTEVCTFTKSGPAKINAALI